MSKKSRAGKEFEELIARIEGALAPIGAVIKSPDYIRDLVTNRFREVDASIRVPNGDTTRLITVECRDHRKGKQDDRWIEQLITKREKIGAWRTIAVSSSGFSDSAITSARHYNIDLRQMNQITDAEIAQEWASGSEFKITIIQVEYFAYSITLFDSNKMAISVDDLSAELLESLRNDLTNTGFIRNKGDDALISAAELSHFVDHPRELKEDGDPIRAIAEIDFNDDNWYVETVSGERVVSRVVIGYEFSMRTYPAPIQSVKQYSSPDKPILELVGAEAQANDRHYKIEARVRLNRPLPTKKRQPKRGRKKVI
ncbi:MAG TPA: hypothetical protein VGC87_05665 [Pyrinomonadaceae bacterium]|jgi:hypothetical protein